MLSYQHGFHAGNLADVHKHALLAWLLAYMTAKDKPLSYIETHAGRGLYDLGSPQALKTGEAAAGIARAAPLFDHAHPYLRALAATRAAHGAQAYPGSPLIAAHGLRAGHDRLSLAELHPAEYDALSRAMAGQGARVYKRDGLEMAQALCPPTPRRGVLMVDPSYEVKADYATIPRALGQIARKWNVGVLVLWYPILVDGPHDALTADLRSEMPEIALFEARFTPARPGHRMVGSGMAVLNPPWGMADEAARLTRLLSGL
ncbi:23S rRNA (adenine(2030)-N(6))-methyltransferase RlmJ [Roseibaca sp. Y0-43]|uniref:23S rRNA (adenine(2030)-N(6))-methyltransferase RlmJ n=1 Tax=Roseibaca sp. Y0-43 TaxID=2816854 RepID=UPI001D0C6A76|nr:23S rRNA (adenine(2030)-N(6))-methyltransferase RlmJ [Roseibaca sp. Y0-43]MCC1482149.1 23S rRNA (adenine(2030)-N(6))-methyltransferase RlmJ [Roseibaca sp. Y0-43]